LPLIFTPAVVVPTVMAASFQAIAVSMTNGCMLVVEAAMHEASSSVVFFTRNLSCVNNKEFLF